MANKMHLKERNVGLGRGGWNCYCCVPAKSKRATWCRMKKRTERSRVQRDIAAELSAAQ